MRITPYPTTQQPFQPPYGRVRQPLPQAPRFGHAAQAVEAGPSMFNIPHEEMRNRLNRMTQGFKNLLTSLTELWTKTDFKETWTRIKKSVWTMGSNALYFGAITLATWIPIPAFRNYIERQFLFSPVKYALREDLEAAEFKDVKHLQDIDFRSIDNNTRLHGWYIPRKDPKKPTIVYAHGRDHNISCLEPVLKAFSEKGYGVFVFDYRGFGNSDGRPSEEGLFNDFESACRYLKEKLGIDYSEQVAVGHSMGGAVVSEVAANRIPNFKAVMLLSTFPDIKTAMGNMREQYKFVKWLFSHEIIKAKLDVAGNIHKITVPVLGAWGREDHVTPVEMGKGLFDKIQHPQSIFTALPKATHSASTLFNAENSEILLNNLETMLDNAERHKAEWSKTA